MPTPRTGCAAAIRTPFATRLDRALVALLSPLDVWCWSERRICGWAAATPPSTAAASATATRARQRQATIAIATATTSSAAKLDWENEIRRPNQTTTSAAAAAHASRSDRPRATRTMLGTIATTRNRPYTDGSQKSELTRKKLAYVFERITFGFSKTFRVWYW